LMAGANNEFIRFGFFLTAALAWVFGMALTIGSDSGAADRVLIRATV